MKKSFKILLVLTVVFVIFLFLGLTYTFYSMFGNSCPSETKIFEYDECRVSYKEITENDQCTPCGGISPCISGVGQHEKILVLKCLCEKEKVAKAKNFANTFMLGESYGIRVPKKLPHTNVAEIKVTSLTQDLIDDICNNIPEPGVIPL